MASTEDAKWFRSNLTAQDNFCEYFRYTTKYSDKMRYIFWMADYDGPQIG